MRQCCSAQLLSNCETAGPAPWETARVSKMVRTAEVVPFRPHFLYSTSLQSLLPSTIRSLFITGTPEHYHHMKNKLYIEAVKIFTSGIGARLAS